ncbi:MAG: cell division topological specificity factor MinE [Pseudanabaena sp.]|nr:MAG: cell division topological specificity factor MinE [Pseudanabaena sp.]
MISTLLDRLFQRSNVPSGAKVKQRLKFILAHDRAAIEPQMFESMRDEIMRVVSKYVELDEGSLDIRLESDKRMTALIANLPIRMVREDLKDLEILFDESTKDLSSDKPDTLALEMDQLAEAALDAIAVKEDIKNTTEDISAERIAGIAERNIEVTGKIRTAANKPQNNEEISNTDVVETDIAKTVSTDVFDSAPSEVVSEDSGNEKDEG